MRILGLTGSIGMGKSTTASMFREFGIPVYDADAAVHALQAEGGKAIPLIDDAFPGVVINGVLDRKALGKHVFADDAAKKRLEAIMHPLAAEARHAFFEDHASAPLVVLDIPLLFETGAHQAVHAVIVVTAPGDVQKARVLAREGMTPDLFEAIVSKQTPDAEKRAGATHIIDTSMGMDAARQRVAEIIEIEAEK